MKSHTDIQIPGYRVESVLGKGGMATVYLATQLSLGRPVALKVLNDPETPQFFERFFNEGRCMARLSHNNLITVHDIGQGDGFYYIVMEYLPGGDLKRRIAQGMKPGVALKTLARLAGCLGYVHGQGIIHRDIKPSNILFRGDGTPVLSDFGIAKLTEVDSELTMTGTVMGSPHYLSPEQAQGQRRLDGRSDLYSMGVLLYEMLTGEKPFAGESFAATLIAHIKEPVPRLPPHLARLQPLLDRLLAKKPEERYRTGAELVKAIQQLRASPVPGPAEDAPPAKEPAPAKRQARQPAPPPWYRRATPYIALSLALGGVLLAWMQMEQTPPAPPPVPAAVNTGPGRVPVTPPAAAPSATATPAASSQPPPVAGAGTPPPGTGGKAETLAAGEPPAARTRRAMAVENLPWVIDAPPAPPEQAVPSPREQEIAELLDQAGERLKENRLSRPRGDSARDLYEKVLALDPGNAAASAGLDRIAARYALFARSSIARGEIEKARRYIRLGLRVRPRHADLMALRRSATAPHPPPVPPATHSRTPRNKRPRAIHQENGNDPPLFNIEHNS